MTKKVTKKVLLDRLYSLYNGSVNLVGECKGMFEETEFKCNICNHTGKTFLVTFLNVMDAYIADVTIS